MAESRYLSCADTAKLIRKALKKAFPGVQFYVRSKTYSGGASIDITWFDGPTSKEVDKVVGPFEGAGFDGMIDLKYYKESWLLPDGTVTYGKSFGTGDGNGRGGSVPGYSNEKPHPDAELVHFGADFIFTQRSFTREFLEEAVKELEERGFMVDQNGEVVIPKIIDDSRWISHSKSLPSATLDRLPIPVDRFYWDFIRSKSKTVKSETKPKESREKSGESREDVKVEVEGNWTWIYFTTKPPREVIESIKRFGFRWGRKREAWFLKRVPSSLELVWDAILVM